ncbi:hypothetical protein BpHYR1_043253 [Brachionus plicatilis]|uniref:Uncharacterized protein n=1 Tax=Brachionus plicatilis TaxID=10195 RepID=A0A3M7P9J6_BRAPC|nr:hypothetical protein BpHYR1_043253 [Brachionus plicatilis]
MASKLILLAEFNNLAVRNGNKELQDEYSKALGNSSSWHLDLDFFLGLLNNSTIFEKDEWQLASGVYQNSFDQRQNQSLHILVEETHFGDTPNNLAISDQCHISNRREKKILQISICLSNSFENKN